MKGGASGLREDDDREENSELNEAPPSSRLVGGEPMLGVLRKGSEKRWIRAKRAERLAGVGPVGGHSWLLVVR